jgi:hypothetical protein
MTANSAPESAPFGPLNTSHCEVISPLRVCPTGRGQPARPPHRLRDKGDRPIVPAVYCSYTEREGGSLSVLKHPGRLLIDRGTARPTGESANAVVCV